MEKINITSEQEIFINYPCLEKAGIRDWILNSFYDLSIYNLDFIKNLTLIKLFHTNENIFGFEFFYDGLSTGYYGVDLKNKDKDVIETCIDISENNYITKVYGSFTVDYITSLIFVLNSGKSNGFINKNLQDRTDLKYFQFSKENEEIISFQFAFGEYLTWICPIFKVKQEFTTDENNKSILKSKLLGKSHDDSKHIYMDKDLMSREIKQISIVHDNKYVKGFEIIYSGNYSTGCNQGLKNDVIIKESLSLEKGERIEKILIRTGDLVDHMSIYTNKGNTISAGGFGGGAHVYKINDIRKSLENKNIEFLGFEAGFLNNLHYLKLILKSEC